MVSPSNQNEFSSNCFSMGTFHSYIRISFHVLFPPYIDDKCIIAVVKSVLCSVNTQYVDIAD